MKLKKRILYFVGAAFIMLAACEKDTFNELIGECPIVISTNPADEAVNVSRSEIVTITFNKEMNEETITSNSVMIEGPAGQVVGNLTYSEHVVTFTPALPLEPNTLYVGKVKPTVKDIKGNVLQEEYTWSFTTSVLTIPTVIATDPENMEINVDLDKTITATFSEAMDPSTITSTSFLVSQNGNPIAGTLSYAGNVATFNPTANLTLGHIYTAKITTVAENLEGTPLATNYVGFSLRVL